MRNFVRLVACATILAGYTGMAAAQPAAAPGAPPANTAPGMSLTSAGFTDGGIIPDKYAQASPMPVSPPLAWDNVPAGTVSFVLILHDPDTAPQKMPVDILHWMAFNIPGTARAIPENIPATAQLPDGTIQIKNFRGDVGFMGPGARAPGPYHHYIFELFALDTKLDLSASASRAEVTKAMEGHILARAADVGRFHR